MNITALMAFASGAQSPVRLQVNDPARAKKTLQKLGIRVTEEEVLRMTLNDSQMRWRTLPHTSQKLKSMWSTRTQHCQREAGKRTWC